MSSQNENFTPKVPEIDLSEGREMLVEFVSEAHKHLLNAKNALLVLDTVADDREAIENIFKSLHTIKGLADFLNLSDIFNLTEVSESLFDMIRKNLIAYEQPIATVTKESIDGLYRLLELLNEQITNEGKLKSPYLDVGPIIASTNSIIFEAKESKDAVKAHVVKRDIPSISIDEKKSDYGELEKILQSSEEQVAIDKKSLQTLISDLTKAKDKLKESQSLILENQRELVKEREVSIKLTQQAQSTARLKSEFLASMAHEIRTLINAILGFTDILKESSLNTKQNKQLDMIVMSGDLLLGIVNDILDFSKMEAGKLKLESIDFNLKVLVEDVFKILRTRLKGKHIDFYFEIGDNVPLNLIGDPTRLKQIIINLLDNAIKFTEQGEVGLTVSLETIEEGFDRKHVLRFNVADTGIGIPEDRKNIVFESFTQASTSDTRKYGGSGLGLTLCKSFIENMGGKIWIESEVDTGSNFIFLIAFSVGKTSQEREGKASKSKELAGKKILVVENNEKVYKAIKVFCEQNSMEIFPLAKNSLEAVKQLKEEGAQSPDIIFINVLLPDKQGYMLASKIKQESKQKGTRIIAMSSEIETKDISEIQRQGFDEYITKPIIDSDLLEVIGVSQNQGAPRRRLSGTMIEKISCEGLKVLVAEDSLPNQELLRAHFESLGCEADYVENGKDAVDMAGKNDYDICFMDLQMPIMGGIEAAQNIRKSGNKKIAIIALTAAEEGEERKKCLASGMNDYLSKPFDLLELKEKIIRSAKM